MCGTKQCQKQLWDLPSNKYIPFMLKEYEIKKIIIYKWKQQGDFHTAL